MYILVNKVMQFGSIIRYTVFNTETVKFGELQDLNNVYFTDIDKYGELDALSCEVTGKSLILLGYAFIKGSKYYIISFGSNYYSIVNKDFLIKSKSYKNFNITNDNKIRFYKHSIPDLTTYFYDSDFMMICDLYDSSINSSGGICTKFFGKEINGDKFGVVKFEVLLGDVLNEVIVYELGKLLGVNVCEAIYGKIGNKRCVLSVYKYNPFRDSIESFYKVAAKYNVGYNEYSKIISKFGDKCYYHFVQSMALDYIVMQNDRHCKNLAIYKEDMYPLYDNSRSLQHGVENGQYTRMQISTIKTYEGKRKLLRENCENQIIKLLKHYNISDTVIKIVIRRYKQVIGGNFNERNALYF